MVAAIQSGVIVYGLEKFYQTWSRSWTVVKGIFNLLKSKLKKEKVEEEEKGQNIKMKIRKSSLKRFEANKLCMLRPVIEINVQQGFN